MPLPAWLPARVVALSLAVASAFALLRLYPDELPRSRHPDLLAAVFSSPSIVFAGRVTLLCLAVFAVLSIGARIVRREWLLRAGPFEVERAAAISERERDELRTQVSESSAEIERLSAAYGALAAQMAAFVHLRDQENERAPD